MRNNPPLRVFFAIELPLAIKKKIDNDIISPLKKNFPKKTLRWTKPDHLHVTLQFLAALKPEDAETLIKNVNSLLNNAKMFHLLFGQVTLFPTPYQPRIISLAVGPNDRLSDLSKQIGEAISALDYPIETRPFRGHLTLGRFIRNNVKRISLKTIELPTIEHLLITELTLFKSEPTKAGSKYVSLARIPLA